MKPVSKLWEQSVADLVAKDERTAKQTGFALTKWGPIHARQLNAIMGLLEELIRVSTPVQTPALAPDIAAIYAEVDAEAGVEG